MSVHTANVLRVFVLGEIFLGIGWLLARLWINRRHPFRYLSLMGIALILYSLFAAAELAFGRWGKPLSWEGVSVFIAATVSLVAIMREGRIRKKGEQDG